MYAVMANTALQHDKQKLHHVLVESKSCKEEVRKLHKTASQLDMQPFAASDSVQHCIEHVRDGIAAVNVVQTSALNCDADLLRFITLLGMLSDLVPEDRSLRKRVVDEMEELLHLNDSTKVTLARLNKQLQAKLIEAVQQAKDDLDTSDDFNAELVLQSTGPTPCNNEPGVIHPHQGATQCTNTNNLCAQCEELSADGYLGTDQFVGQWFCGKCWEEFLQETDTCDVFSALSDADTAYSEVVNMLGYADVPGFVEVPHISPLLYIGNQYSAASGEFDEVISACMPLDLDGYPAKQLCNKTVLFDDWEGLESEQAAAAAAHSIVAGAELVNDALDSGKRTLVHCEYGQNRSGAICCAYAVLFKQWTAMEAIDYFRCCNLRDRCYVDQRPMNNDIFNSIIEQLER